MAKKRRSYRSRGDLIPVVKDTNRPDFGLSGPRFKTAHVKKKTKR